MYIASNVVQNIKCYDVTERGIAVKSSDTNLDRRMKEMCPGFIVNPNLIWLFDTKWPQRPIDICSLQFMIQSISVCTIVHFVIYVYYSFKCSSEY